MKEIILTGFQKYGQHDFNPTASLVMGFDKKIFDENRSVTSMILTASYDAFGELEDTLLTKKPYAIINVGLSSSLKVPTLEMTFTNRMGHHYPDAKGVFPKNQTIIDKNHHCLAPIGQGKDLYTQFSAAKVPIDVSCNAGTFICNALGYKLTDAILRNNLETKNLFLHMPWTTDYEERVSSKENKNFLPKEQIQHLVELLIKQV